MDGNSEGSSTAARSAQALTAIPQNRPNSFFDWAFRRKRPVDQDAPKPATELDRANAAEQRRMLVNLRNMRDLRLEDVAVPRADITGVPSDISLDDLLDAFRDSGFSRIPVYEDTLDSPMGLVHLKDVALNYGFDGKKSDWSLAPLVRPLLYAPPSMPISALLQRMQSERMHMALVIDEYGGVDGLVTMEDLVEQIVGEIADEHDTDEEDEWVEEAPGCYRADARAALDEFEKAAGVDLLPDDLDEEVETLGGLAFMLAGHVPARGEVVRHPAGHDIEVLDADPRRIKRLRLRLKGAAQMARAAE